jgi:hypothetical protein
VRDALLDQGGACEAGQHEISISPFSPYLCCVIFPNFNTRSILYLSKQKKVTLQPFFHGDRELQDPLVV